MFIKTLALYLVGDAAAIREVAANKAALWTGLVLVLTASIAREYDQSYILEKIPFIFPLIMSVIASWLIHASIWLFLIPRERFSINGMCYRTMLTLFWMTAPIAWLYAIPVERFMPSLEATHANAALLSVIATWRVLLITRVISVLLEAQYLRVLICVLFPSAAILFVGSFFTSLSLLRGMGGMVYSPEERFLMSVANFGYLASIIVGIPSFLACLAISVKKKQAAEVPYPTEWAFPALPLGGLLILWCLAAIKPQMELGLNFEVRQLSRTGKHVELLALMSKHSPGDFAPARRIAPDPFEYEGARDLPKIIGAMNGSEAPWVRERYLSHLKIIIQHAGWRFGIDDSASPILDGLNRIPEGRDWMKQNWIEFARWIEISYTNRDAKARKEIAERLQGMGFDFKFEESRN